MKCCPTCGQSLPRDKLIKGLVLRGISEQIYKLVSRAGPNGINTVDLFEMLYANTRNGGPDSGPDIIKNHVWFLNKKIKPFKKAVRADHTGRGHYGFYRVVNL